MTIASALRDARDQLNTVVDNASLEAELLLSHILCCSRTHLHARPEHGVTDTQLQQFHAILKRRIAGEPIAYLTGTREFWSMQLSVNAHTLIPRPETELLVELALECIPVNAAWEIADLGTGSGAIALALARERPHCHLTATDLSVKALAVARDNAKRLAVTNVRFHHSHWFKGLGQRQFQMIVANPPYIPAGDPHLQQGDLRFEPQAALVAGADGLSDLRAIAEQARYHLQAPGWLILEHGFDQGSAVLDLVQGLGYQQPRVITDLSGNDRIILAKWVNMTHT